LAESVDLLVKIEANGGGAAHERGAGMSPCINMWKDG